jgi:hypothetical protein
VPRVLGAQVREYLVALGARQEYAQERDRKPRERSERVHVRAPRRMIQSAANAGSFFYIVEL